MTLSVSFSNRPAIHRSRGVRDSWTDRMSMHNTFKSYSFVERSCPRKTNFRETQSDTPLRRVTSGQTIKRIKLQWRSLVHHGQSRQDLLSRTKKTAMDLMFLADKAEQEASKEASRLQDMQRAPSHSDESVFDNRVGQRRVWMAKNEVALQVITCYTSGCCCRIPSHLVGRNSKACVWATRFNKRDSR